MTIIDGQFPVVEEGLVANINANASASQLVDLKGFTLLGIYVPNNFQGTNVTFKCALNKDDTPSVMKDSGGVAVNAVVSAGDYVSLDPVTFAGVRFLQLVSGSTETAARAIKLSARAV